MADFLDIIETYRANQAGVQKIFGGEGVRARAIQRRPDYPGLIAEAAKLVADVYRGRLPTWYLKEAMTTADFPLLFGDIIDRQVLANYMEWQTTWQNYMKRGTVSDFRTTNRHFMGGAEGVLPSVAQQDEYPETALTEGRYQLAVTKYGTKIGFSWEAMINDDLDLLKDIPQRFGRAARRTEERFATVLFVDTSGPHASLYTAGNGNIITGNPPLSIAALQTAMTVLGAMTDSDGEPIQMDAIELVVPPGLMVTAQNILNALQIVLAEAGGTANQNLWAQNWMKSKMRLSVNPYVPLVASVANGNTSWFLFGNPNSGRPAAEIVFLRGHEQPEIFIKEPNQRRVGGGTADPMDGDFDTDSITYKVRHVLGGGRQEPSATVASNGTNVP